MSDLELLDLSAWGLSSKAIETLRQEPEIIEYVRHLRTLPPLNPDFQPQLLEIRFDDVTYICYERGNQFNFIPCSPDLQPSFSEYRLDGETILFHIGGEIVVDRTVNLNIQQIFKTL
ncbi:hypothetical protein [Myxosarcina sp. GI1]|uniref:hypothetical protein n=1 Tax=Myxosarcina sp. GI1 TaxID=1541065 RepID=UPI00056A808E|nr:hypothetical protein [Myxosarcina sp. GI1]